MTPQDPNQVIRLKVHYTGPLDSHTMLFHKRASADATEFITAVRGVIEGMAALVYQGTSFHTAERAEAGSPLFFPISWTPIGTTNEQDPSDTDGAGKFLQFGGRGSDGVRVKWYLFETPALLKADMRYGGGESDPVDDVVSLLVTNSNWIGTVSGSNYSTYSYANIGFNDHAVKKAR